MLSLGVALYFSSTFCPASSSIRIRQGSLEAGRATQTCLICVDLPAWNRNEAKFGLCLHVSIERRDI